MTLTENQIKVVDEATKRLGKHSWFKGICLDNIPSDQECADDFENAVSSMVCQTEMWDSPNWPGNQR